MYSVNHDHMIMIIQAKEISFFLMKENCIDKD